MSYSINGSRTRIYPGTIQFQLAVNAKPRHNLVSYQCQPAAHKLVIDQPKTNGRDQLSIFFHGHKHVIDQCQTNEHGQLALS